MLDRRTFLAAAALSASAGAPLAADASGHPDAELLHLWELYRAQYRAIDGLPDEDSPVRDAAYQAMYATEEQFKALAPRTMRGIAVKLRYLFANYNEGFDASESIFHDKPLPASELADHRDRMLWDLIGQLEGKPLPVEPS